jgi:hypothetical protein
VAQDFEVPDVFGQPTTFQVDLPGAWEPCKPGTEHKLHILSRTGAELVRQGSAQGQQPEGAGQQGGPGQQEGAGQPAAGQQAAGQQ